jgi:hypothetical protein
MFNASKAFIKSESHTPLIVLINLSLAILPHIY